MVTDHKEGEKMHPFNERADTSRIDLSYFEDSDNVASILSRVRNWIPMQNVSVAQSQKFKEASELLLLPENNEDMTADELRELFTQASKESRMLMLSLGKLAHVLCSRA